MNRGLALFLAISCVLGSARDSRAYLKLGVRVDDRQIGLRWVQTPVRYFVTNRGVPGVSPSELQAAAGRAFATWQQAPGATIAFEFAGFTDANPFHEDGISTVGFLDAPELERVLGATAFLVDVVTGEILESDIFFNAAMPWSVMPGGEPGRFDLESIAVHEVGHFLGLGHSAIGETELLAAGGRRVIAAETVMFPIAFSPGNIDGRTLKADDVAGVSDIYPAAGARARTGSIRGRVLRNGVGQFGAHVVALHMRTGRLVGNFTLSPAGDFAIALLEPGPHILRVEPLDDGDVESFFDPTRKVDLDFGATYLTRFAVVPRAGTADVGNIIVRAR